MKLKKTLMNLKILMLVGGTLAFTGSAVAASSLSSELAKQVIQSVDDDAERITAIFKDFHEHPELGLMETRTSGIVAKELKSLGFEVKTGIGKTGVVGIMRNGDGPVVLYRGEMDALPVKELTGLPYASKAVGTDENGVETPLGHMCGHDAHTTWMLSAAHTMATNKDKWSGTLIILGQPAEETVAGATAMVDDGLWKKYDIPKPDYALAMHSGPMLLGTLVGSPGVIMAGSEQIDVTFHGVGGHGSSPQYTKDPVIMATYAIAQYQAIVSRVIDPRDPAVITVGSVEAGTSNNVIPESATLKINTRYFNESVREQLFKGIEAISNGIARTYGMPEEKFPTIVRKGHSYVVTNDKELTERTNAAELNAGLVSDKTLVAKFRPVTGSEDFSNLFHDLKDTKQAYYMLGIVNPDLWAKTKKEGKEVPWANHNPHYEIDLAAIPLGGKIASIMVMDLMAK